MKLFKYLMSRSKIQLQKLKLSWSLSHFLSNMNGFQLLIFKDARSVYLYPYNRSQILQYVKYTK